MCEGKQYSLYTFPVQKVWDPSISVDTSLVLLLCWISGNASKVPTNRNDWLLPHGEAALLTLRLVLLPHLGRTSSVDISRQPNPASV